MRAASATLGRLSGLESANGANGERGRLLKLDPAEKVVSPGRLRSPSFGAPGIVGGEHESSEFQFAGFPFR